jgi:two-component system, NtrC family, response regulator HydG
MDVARIVLVDEPGARHGLAQALRQAGHEVRAASDAFEALKLVEEDAPDLTVSDLVAPGMGGIDLLRQLRQRDPDAQVLLLSAARDVDSAVEAMREGAFHYFCKPVDVDRLLATVGRALEARRQRRQEPFRLPPTPGARRLLGGSPELQNVLKTVALVAPTRATVLVTGESGTGKELVAEAIHETSPRAAGPLIRLSCASLADTLLESELFGHERGAFTGADRARVGRIERAHGGSLFLDEIGEITAPTQVKLLRFLQERVFERVGGNRTIGVDVRLIAATNRDLRALVESGAFREDLFYRLNVVAIHLPPLRERVEDIPVLAAAFLKKYAEANTRPARAFDEGALAALSAYPWPGNVRELQNVIERAVVLANCEVISREHLPAELGGVALRQMPRVPGASLEELERYAILTTLEANGGSTVKAAATLGISVRKIQYRLQQYATSARASRAPGGRRSSTGEGQATP